MTTDTWNSRLREARFEEAAHRARLEGAPADLVASLDDLAAVERALRDRRYGAARRSLKRYLDHLDGVQDAALLRSLVAHGPLEAAVLALEGAEEGRITEPDELRDRLRDAFALPLTAGEAHNVVGVLHARRGEPEEARTEFDAALRSDPRHYRALTNVGNLLLEVGNLDEAEGYYRRALEINADYPGAHHNLAVVLRRRRKYGASVRALKTSQRLTVRQANVDSREEQRERFSKLGMDPAKVLRVLLTVVVVLAVLWFLRGQGG